MNSDKKISHGLDYLVYETRQKLILIKKSDKTTLNISMIGKIDHLSLDYSNILLSSGSRLFINEIINPNNLTFFDFEKEITNVRSEFDSVIIFSGDDVFVMGCNSYSRISQIEVEHLFSPVYFYSNIVAISCGLSHCVFIDREGITRGNGNSNTGSLGRTEFLRLDSAILETEGIQMKDVACGDNFTILLSKEGKVYSSGSNICGQLGIGNNESLYSFTPIGLIIPTDKFKICCGSFHVLVLSENKLLGWGSNYLSQLSHPDRNYILSPSLIEIENIIVDVYAAPLSTLVLDEIGNIWICGSNEFTNNFNKLTKTQLVI